MSRWRERVSHPLVLVAFSVACLVGASFQKGFSIAAFLVWGFGCIAWMLIGDYDSTSDLKQMAKDLRS